MQTDFTKKRIGILGGGPAALFMYKRLIELGTSQLEIHIYERRTTFGAGMPYSEVGANEEHVTNVSDNEIPEIVTHISDWVHTVPRDILDKFDIHPDRFNEYKVLPRLFFGMYLHAQFELLLQQADAIGITTHIHLSTLVTDIIDQPAGSEVWVQIDGDAIEKFDQVIICTGHHWPRRHEGKVSGYYDSPYPPAKLKMKIDHPVAIRGASLTAIDAIRTLARHNGIFEHTADGKLKYHPTTPGFRIAMHSRSGLLPAIRFHLEDTHLSKDGLLTSTQIAGHMAANDGFLSLDFLFEKDFKETFRDKDPEFYQRVKNMSVEEFVEDMMSLREKVEPFQLFRAEYAEAEKSIKRKESVYWKEKLAILSFAMNYPAKHFSAEDMLRLQKVLMPLISIVIAFVPQGSSSELLAMHDAGILDITSVGHDSRVEPHEESGITYHYDEDKKNQSTRFQTFIDCIGQPHLSYSEFPFRSLIESGSISPARLRFRSPAAGSAAMEGGHQEVQQFDTDAYYLRVPGITIDDDFRIMDSYGASNPRIYIMAVPYIGGYNPDYSGLDFCEAASDMISKSILKEIASE